MSTLIMSRRLPRFDTAPLPEPRACAARSVAPAVCSPTTFGNAPGARSETLLVMLVVIALHGGLMVGLMISPPAAPEPQPPMPITVQWLSPPPAPLPAQAPAPAPATTSPAAAEQPPAAQAPAPVSPEPKPVEKPRPKPQPAHTASKPVAKPSTPSPTATPAPAAAQTDASRGDAKPAPTQAQPQTPAQTSAPIGRAGYLNNPAPVYPPAAARRRQEGTTLLRVHVLPNGHTDRVEVLQTSGIPALDDAAQAAVRQWTFIPAKRGETPVEGWVNVPLAFKLTP